MDLSNVAGTEWEEISATSFQNLENHSTKLDAIILMVIISDALIYSICIGQYWRCWLTPVAGSLCHIYCELAKSKKKILKIDAYNGFK